jgi:ectoine hydroxylase-related dioxygenase (phytanoyl-CoA dioxygenase family)
MDRVWAGDFDLGRAPNGYFNPGDERYAMRKANNGWQADSAIRALVTLPSIAECAARLLGADVVRLWEDQLLDKPGGGLAEANVGWHTDWTYWGGAVEEPRMLTAWVPYQEVNSRNGAMQFVDGSHRWSDVQGSDFFETDREGQLARIVAGHEDAQVVTLELAAGQVSFHSPLLLHGSGPNLSSGRRRATAIHLFDGAVRSRRLGEGWAHYNVDLLVESGRAVGDTYEGEHWPVLYPVSA